MPIRYKPLTKIAAANMPLAYFLRDKEGNEKEVSLDEYMEVAERYNRDFTATDHVPVLFMGGGVTGYVEKSGWIRREVEKATKVGPMRVVIDASGEATTTERALLDYGIESDVIYVRDDGWSLGAPAQFVQVAKQLWDDAWVAVAWKIGDDWKWKKCGGKEKT